MGRPINHAKKEKVARRHPINLRATFNTRKRIEDAASKSGRSMSQELEFIVEQYFQRRDLLKELIQLATEGALESRLKTRAKIARTA